VSFVRTADLDLSTAAGQRALDQRFAQAAREVCGAASPTDLQGRNAVRQCRSDVLAKARSERESLMAVASRGAIIGITSLR
jgi:UrcA family protein